MQNERRFKDGQSWSLDRCTVCTCQVHNCLSPLQPVIWFVCLNVQLNSSVRQVRCGAHRPSVPSCPVCIKSLIQDPAVLAVEVNWLFLSSVSITGIRQSFPSQAVCTEVRSTQRAAAGLQTPPPVCRASVWTEWPPAPKCTVCPLASTSSVCPGSAAQYVPVRKFPQLSV